MSTDNTNMAKRLQSLRDELRQTLTQTRSRRRRLSFLLILLVLVIAGYWTYIYMRVTTIDANLVSDLAYIKTLEYVKQQQPAVSKALRDRAPEVFDYAETQILQSPAMLAPLLQKAALEKTQLVLDNAEPRITQVIDDGIAHAKASMNTVGIDAKDPKQVDKFINELTRQLYANVKEGLNKVYIDYDAKAIETINYLNKISAGKDINEREKHLRTVMISFLALDAKRNMGK